MDAPFSAPDRTLLRDLARRVAEIAAHPVMQQRRDLWYEHNSLLSKRPMMLLFPEGAWTEILPDAALACTDPDARAIEQNLRIRIHTFEHFQDDSVIEAEWVVPAVLSTTGWGVDIQRHPSTETRGAWAFEPILRSEADLKQLHYPDLIYDEAASQRAAAQMHDLLGDILTVKPAGIKHISYHLMSQYTDWCGLSESLLDMADRPEFVHTVLRFLEEGHRRLLGQWIDANLLSLNNDSTYHSSGGNGYTRELPAPGFDPLRVRPCDMWASAESQELAQVSPRMHAEFALAYEKRLLAPFGLTGYGCCEDLSRKLDDVLTIPHIRRISISPFASVDKSAPKLQDRAIFSWKPHPSHLVGDFDEQAVREYIRHTLTVCAENNCVLEMILKDTHTCEFHPERFDAWTRIARDLIHEFGWN